MNILANNNENKIVRGSFVDKDRQPINMKEYE